MIGLLEKYKYKEQYFLWYRQIIKVQREEKKLKSEVDQVSAFWQILDKAKIKKEWVGPDLVVD